MPKPRTGEVRFREHRCTARITIGKGKRRVFEYPQFTDDARDRTAAEERAKVMSDMARTLVVAGHADMVVPILEKAAVADAQRMADVGRVVSAVVKGDAIRVASSGMSVRRLGELWTSGDLHRQYPDHVKAKRSVSDDIGRLEKHVYPVVGHILVEDFTLDDADLVMTTAPRSLSKATRRQIAQVLSRLMNLSVYPCRVREASPIPRGWLPDVDRKTKAFLYPDEEASLLADREMPLADRVAHGFMTREGMRKGEALGLTWGDVDLARGAVTLDANKTDDPRAWALGADVVTALSAWRDHRGTPEDDELVFGLNELRSDKLRARLIAVGVTRRQIHEKSATRDPYNVHAHRGTFVTVELAQERSESWISDRTGHRSSTMINRYKRQARTAAELGLGRLAPMDRAIPELALRHGKGTPTLPVESVAQRPQPQPHDFNLVPEVGLEPTQGCPRRILNPLRLPFRHSG